MMQAAYNQAAWFHFEIADAVIGTAYAYSEFSFTSLTFEMTGRILLAWIKNKRDEMKSLKNQSTLFT